jgi:CRP/FNR family transcriptional regulator
MLSSLDTVFLHRLDSLPSRRRVVRRGKLYRAGEVFSAVYVVGAGTFKTVIASADGREQVTAFYLAGDIMGGDGLGENRYPCDAIALEDSEASIIFSPQLKTLANDESALPEKLYRHIAKEACRRQEMMLLLGTTTAKERLANFLLDLASRYHARGYSKSELMLRMSRSEIASYIGLKFETVSRLLTRLQSEGLLQVQGRAVKLLDFCALEDLAGKRSRDSSQAVHSQRGRDTPRERSLAVEPETCPFFANS